MEMPMVASAKRKRGRPRKAKTLDRLLQLRISPEMHAAIERARLAEEITTHAETARRLLAQKLREDNHLKG